MAQARAVTDHTGGRLPACERSSTMTRTACFGLGERRGVIAKRRTSRIWLPADSRHTGASPPERGRAPATEDDPRLAASTLTEVLEARGLRVPPCGGPISENCACGRRESCASVCTVGERLVVLASAHQNGPPLVSCAPSRRRRAICRALGVAASAYYQRATVSTPPGDVKDERLLGVLGNISAANYHA